MSAPELQPPQSKQITKIVRLEHPQGLDFLTAPGHQQAVTEVPSFISERDQTSKSTAEGVAVSGVLLVLTLGIVAAAHKLNPRRRLLHEQLPQPPPDGPPKPPASSDTIAA